MKKINLLLSIVFILTVQVQAQKYTISGLITDSKNGETLISAAIFESNSRKGTVTNPYGFYSLTVQKGEVAIIYSYVGFAPQQLKLDLLKDTVINIRLNESIELNEVTVLGNNKNLGVQGSQMSAIDIPISQIKAVPALFGETDVIKALLLLPGVKGGAEGSSQIYVRGGGPDEPHARLAQDSARGRAARARGLAGRLVRRAQDAQRARTSRGPGARPSGEGPLVATPHAPDVHRHGHNSGGRARSEHEGARRSTKEHEGKSRTPRAFTCGAATRTGCC